MEGWGGDERRGLGVDGLVGVGDGLVREEVAQEGPGTHCDHVLVEVAVAFATVAGVARETVFDVMQGLGGGPVGEALDGAARGGAEALRRLHVALRLEPAGIPFAHGEVEAFVVQELVAASAEGDLAGGGLHEERRLGGLAELFLQEGARGAVVAVAEREHELKARHAVVDERLVGILVHAVRVEPPKLSGELALDERRIAAEARMAAQLLARAREDGPVLRDLGVRLGDAGVGGCRHDLGDVRAPGVCRLLREELRALHLVEAEDDLLDGEIISYAAAVARLGG